MSFSRAECYSRSHLGDLENPHGTFECSCCRRPTKKVYFRSFVFLLVQKCDVSHCVFNIGANILYKNYSERITFPPGKMSSPFCLEPKNITKYRRRDSLFHFIPSHMAVFCQSFFTTPLILRCKPG